jgi:hypothetical protein
VFRGMRDRRQFLPLIGQVRERLINCQSRRTYWTIMKALSSDIGSQTPMRDMATIRPFGLLSRWIAPDQQRSEMRRHQSVSGEAACHFKFRISAVVCPGLCFMRILHANSSGLATAIVEGNRPAHHAAGA